MFGRAATVEAGGRPLPARPARQADRHTGVPFAARPVAPDNRRYGGAGLAAVGIGAGMAGYHCPADSPDREIVAAVGLAQSTVSQHLKIRTEVRLVLVEPVRTARHYRINEACVGCFPSAADVVMGRPAPSPTGAC